MSESKLEKMVYVICDYEGDIICVCENEEIAKEVLAEQEDGVLMYELVPYYPKSEKDTDE